MLNIHWAHGLGCQCIRSVMCCRKKLNRLNPLRDDPEIHSRQLIDWCEWYSSALSTHDDRQNRTRFLATQTDWSDDSSIPYSLTWWWLFEKIWGDSPVIFANSIIRCGYKLSMNGPKLFRSIPYNDWQIEYRFLHKLHLECISELNCVCRFVSVVREWFVHGTHTPKWTRFINIGCEPLQHITEARPHTVASGHWCLTQIQIASHNKFNFETIFNNN